MAHNVEPMDIDNIDSDFDNKENNIHHSNVYPRTPCTEKGYEELDVSELNMKLRYSVTPAASPMSKSYTATCDNRGLDSIDETINSNLTRSLHSTFTRNELTNKSIKSLPLQTLSTDQLIDNNRNASVLRPLGSLDATTIIDGNVTVTVTRTNGLDENLSIPSSSSSTAHTPEATTPTKENPCDDGGSPIMRGLKSVLNMFRSSQSPIPTAADDNSTTHPALSPQDCASSTVEGVTSTAVLASTPIANKHRESSVKQTSPHKESLVFNEDLERELLWKDETTILFSEEKIPIHKLFYQQPSTKSTKIEPANLDNEENLNSTVEYMDISYNDSMIKNKTITGLQTDGTNTNESDSEFVDCETTFTNDKSDVDLKEIASVQENVITETESHTNILGAAPLSDFNSSTAPPCPESLNNVPEIKTISESTLAKNESPLSLENSSFADMYVQPATENPVEINNQNINSILNVSENTTHFNNTCETDNLQPLEHLEANIPEPEIDVLNERNLNVTHNTSGAPNGCNMTVENIYNVMKSDTNAVQTSLIPQTQENNSSFNNEITNCSNATISLDTTKITNDTHLPSGNNSSIEDDVNNVTVTEDQPCNFLAPSEKNLLKSDDFENNKNTTTEANILNPEDEDNVDMPTINNSMDTYVPADIPLPDEDDVENEKSLGTVILMEGETAPLNSINGIDTKELTTMPGESEYRDVSNNISCSVEEKESAHNGNIITSIDVTGDIPIKFEGFQPMSTLQQDMPMDINNILNDDGVGIPKISENVDQLAHISMKQDLNVRHVNIDNQVFEETQNNVENNIIQNTESIHVPMTTTNIVSQPICDEANVLIPDNLASTFSIPEQKEISGDQLVVETVAIPSNNTNKTTVNSLFEITHNSNFEVTKTLIPEINKIKLDNNIASMAENNENDIKSSSQNIQDRNDNLEVTSNTGPLKNDDGINVLSTNNEIVTIAPLGSLDETDEGNRTNVNLEEENIISENNSPYVSIASQKYNIEGDENVKSTENATNKTKLLETPPLSPKIVSKGYNFNFDEIDDPFATKTKIRTSPSPEKSFTNTTDATFEDNMNLPTRDLNKNRRKSQPERKKSVMPKKKLNATFNGNVKTPVRAQKTSEDPICPSNSNPPTLLTTQTNPESPIKISVFEQTNENLKLEEEISIPKTSTDNRDTEVATEDTECERPTLESTLNISNNDKTTSSSEQSTYYSAAGTSSGDSAVSRNVFNIPEIDDKNFNPFVTKSKMRASPPPSFNIENEATIGQNETVKPDNTSTEFEETIGTYIETKACDMIDEKDNIDDNNTTCSSKATEDKDVTIREVHTEDEDTEEGPFLEIDDNTDKISDFDDDDMMQFTEIPPQINDENIGNDEMFIDAEAFEFLLNQNKSNVVSDSGKESLFLKFDPLFAKRVSTDGVLAALSKVQKRQSTPKKVTAHIQMDATFEKPVAGPSVLNVTQELETNVTAEDSTDELNVTVSKPMMVVTPAVNPIVTPRNKTMTPTSSNRRSITFTSPAIAVIDRLLSLSANNSLVGHDTTISHVSREQNEADLALTQLRELLAEKEINVYNLRCESKDLKDRLTSMESQMKVLETESEERLRKVNELNDRLTEKTKINKSMAAVVEEYERTIASLIAETELDKKRNNEERTQLIKERDEQTAHLASMEVSFSDLHSKYEKSKQIILTCKSNEDAYKKSIKDFEDNLSKMQKNYELLKQHATSKLNHANQELEKMNRAHEAEVLKLNAMIKRKDLHITSLEETLAQKTKANEELTAICDELINKVG